MVLSRDFTHKAQTRADLFFRREGCRVPRRDDIHKILLIGSGPIVIGQACEFDYSGTQACKALREEGYEVVLVNSNPATIMTDPQHSGPDVYRTFDVGDRGEGDRERAS